MNPKVSSRILVLRVSCLVAFTLVVVVIASGRASRSFWQTPHAAAALEPHLPKSSGPLVWVRQDGVVINVNGDPLRYEYPDPRFEGSFTQYVVTEGAFSKQERFVDHEYEFYNVFIDSEFDQPPLVLTPPLRYKLRGSYAHGGTYNGGGMVGAKLHYFSDWAYIEPAVIQGYFPWEPWFDGNATTEWMISAPAPSQPGQIMKVTAAWIDCPPCNVTWTYEAEPAYEVEQLGAEVVAPVVKYQEEEVVPGQTFFPGTCVLPDGRAALCGQSIELSDSARLKFMCVLLEKHDQLLLLLDLMDIDIYEEPEFYLDLWRHKERCGLNASRDGGDYQIGLVLEKGALLFENVAGDQTTRVTTQLGSATSGQRGAFAVAFQSEERRAIFLAFSAPLTIQPEAGSSLALQPGQQVQLTAAGFGPVSALQQVYLPATIR